MSPVGVDTSAVVRTDLAAPPLPPGRPRLVITGFMGTGKTSAGRLAAARLGLPFVDLDDVVARRAGVPVAEIFARDGEEAFRHLERDVLREAARLSGTVIATGGGAVLSGEAFGALAESAEVALLTCEPDELARRLAEAGGRPLLTEAAGPGLEPRVAALLAERAERYAAAGSALDTTRLEPPAVASALADRYRERDGAAPIVRIEVRGPKGPYPVVVGPGALAALPETLAGILPDARTAVIVADEAAVATAGSTVADALGAAGFEPLVLELPAGERAKTIGVVAGLWERLRRAGVSRTDVVVAVGGGAALDTAGFAAATFGRGMPSVNVPTTLLAMIDASLGGKVGIDHAGAKNLVGAFHHPVLVVTDPSTVANLPPEILRQGLAEAIKAFVLASPLALEIVEDASLDGRGLLRPAELAWLVEQAVRVKAAYVARDPEDRHLRHSLNLGHTFAHAVESASGYEVAHGDAVAIGVVAAARLGEAANVTPAGVAARLAVLFARFGLPLIPPAGLDRAAMLEAVVVDKKRRGGRAVFVVPAPGGCALLEGLDPAEALSFLGDG